MRNTILFFCLSWLLFVSCEEQIPVETPLIIREDLSTLEHRTQQILRSTAIQTAEGIEVSLWATDSLAPDPIAMSINDEGAIYITRTNRQKNSEFDIRGYQRWMTQSIGFESVADRQDFLKEEFSPARSEENNWHPDLNNDSINDWRDLAVERDEVWKLEDLDGDGQAEISTRVVNDFNSEVSDVANALLVRDQDLFVGVAPDMWRMQDTNGDQVYDKKESLATGFGVHIGFSGHGMSGAVMGPDGKLYWGIGDIGANITDRQGNQHKYSNQGVLVRCYPDGSDFEVFAHGLRNVHEFTFDEYGNIIGADNDGDHRGEKERLVHIVEGADAGWRINWQFGKYQDPKNNNYKVWMDESMHLPRQEGQAAYFMPPLSNIHNGPTGMVYNPGHALGQRWKKHFFLVEFPGYPAGAHIWAFTVRPQGATFALDREVDFMSGVLATGIRFGPDGALYASDWINGWGTKNYGRVWKFDVRDSANDLSIEREKTNELIRASYPRFTQAELFDLLGYEDQRIRQKAQFELVRRESLDLLIQATDQKTHQLARVHGIWGLGQLGAQYPNAMTQLLKLLNDRDEEIISQSLKVLGDIKYGNAAEVVRSFVNHQSDRVKFFATQAMGRMAYQVAIPEVLQMIELNADEDLYLRHAGALALSRMATEDQLASLSNEENYSIRLASVLALRRMRSTRLADFLQDPDEYIVAEAARAIHDDWSVPAALPSLAQVLEEDRFSSEPLIRRALSACLRVGGDQNIDRLIQYATNPMKPVELRTEALNSLAYWQSPSLYDRVDGRYRNLPVRDASSVVEKLSPLLGEMIHQEEIGVAALRAIGELAITDYDKELVQLVTSGSYGANRKFALASLSKLNYQGLGDVVTTAINDKDVQVRAQAISLLNEVSLEDHSLEKIISATLEKGTLAEQQNVLQALGKMPLSVSGANLEKLVRQLESGMLNPALRLDLIEVVEESGDKELIDRLAKKSTEGALLKQYSEVLYGGDAGKGQQYFYADATGQCTRCHAMGGYGGDVGPPLTYIGKSLTREQLLEALVDPSARLAPGFGMVSVTLMDGQQITGTLMTEDESEITLKTSEAEPLHISKARILKRSNVPSSMPAMGQVMSRRELRDLIAYLSQAGN